MTDENYLSWRWSEAERRRAVAAAIQTAAAALGGPYAYILAAGTEYLDAPVSLQVPRGTYQVAAFGARRDALFARPDPFVAFGASTITSDARGLRVPLGVRRTVFQPPTPGCTCASCVAQRCTCEICTAARR